MKDDLAEYLSSNNLEDHISSIINIVSRYDKKKIPVRSSVRTIKRKGSKEVLYENEFFEIVKDYHTKEKCDISVLKLKRKIWLEKDDFSELKEYIEGYDGYYSGFSGGFIFKSLPTTKVSEEIKELIKSLL
jgi:hypothetical protein